MALPLYNDTDAAVDLVGIPPFLFPGITLRYFPLRADMYVLRSFCAELLGVIPPEVAEFEPYVPYVYLVVMDYGRMSSGAASLGWISQHEIAFAIPLLQYRRRNGRREQVGPVSLTPYIFVDNPMSLTTGREVYGWPKELIVLDGDVEPWLDDPVGPLSLMRLSMGVLAAPGEIATPRVLVEVENLQPLASRFGLPGLRPWLETVSAVPRAALGALSLGRDMMDVWAAPPLRGYAPGDRALLVQSLLRGFADGLPLRNPYWQVVTLKQFRDAVNPSLACYQGLVTSRLKVGRLNEGGLLGDWAYLQGDLSGGYRIKVHSYASQPIVSSLGLEVEEQITLGDRTVDVLRPVCPYWLDLDLHYGRGRTLCWRTQRSSWNVGEKVTGRQLPPQSPGNLFVTAEGLANADLPGPFAMDEGMVHVLALQASSDLLRRFIGGYLDIPQDLGLGCFEPWAPVVYLVVGGFGLVTSTSQPVGFTSSGMAGLFIPVRWTCQDDSRLVFIAPFLFTDNQFVAITGQEESGFSMLQSTLETPAGSWLRSPAQLRPLMKISALIFPAAHLGAKAEPRHLLTIAQGPLGGVEDPGDRSRDGFAIPQHPGPLPMQLITLKQIRDAWNPRRACFQEYLVADQLFQPSHEVSRLAGLHVWIFRYSTLPIVQALGLSVVKRGPGVPWGESQGAGVDILRPIHAFSVPGSLQGGGMRSLCWRAGSTVWQRSSPDLPVYVAGLRGGAPGVGSGAGAQKPGTAP